MLWIALVVCLTATTTMVASLDHYQSLADLVAAASRGHARKEPPTHHAASNVIFCDMRQMTTQASNTSSNSKLCAPGKLEFSFSVFLNHPGGKKESMSELSSLRRLAKTLSESSRCDVHHLKYEERAQRLAESRAGDQTSFWHEDKKTKSTSRPQVSVIRDESKHNGSQRKSLVVFECSLPASDVWLSVNGSPRPPKSAHTHPHAAGQVTVSAMRVTLSFAKSLDDTLSVNVRNKQLTHDHAVDGYHPSNSSSSSSSFFTNRKSTERYLVYYDGKCKKCGVAVQTRVIDPFQAQSLKCATKVKANFAVKLISPLV